MSSWYSPGVKGVSVYFFGLEKRVMSSTTHMKLLYFTVNLLFHPPYRYLFLAKRQSITIRCSMISLNSSLFFDGNSGGVAVRQAYPWVSGKGIYSHGATECSLCEDPGPGCRKQMSLLTVSGPSDSSLLTCEAGVLLRCRLRFATASCYLSGVSTSASV